MPLAESLLFGLIPICYVARLNYSTPVSCSLPVSLPPNICRVEKVANSRVLAVLFLMILDMSWCMRALVQACAEMIGVPLFFSTDNLLSRSSDMKYGLCKSRRRAVQGL